MEKKQKSQKRKLIIPAALVLVTLFSLIGSIAAYFSDKATGEIDVQVGTLAIDGTYEFKINGSSPVVEVVNFNPGDIVNVKINVSNLGNKSAWIRDLIEVTSEDENIFDYIEVYAGNYDQTSVVGETAIQLVDGVASSSVKVIDGVGTGAELESGVDYNYLQSSSYTEHFTLYFSPLAGNEVQGKTFDIKVVTQALQFRNNKTTIPTEGAWATVSSHQ